MLQTMVCTTTSAQELIAEATATGIKLSLKHRVLENPSHIKKPTHSQSSSQWDQALVHAFLARSAQPPDKQIALPTPELPFKINHTGQQQYAPIIVDAALTKDLSPALLMAVVAAESNFDPHATSSAGAQGLMQLMPATAQRYGVQDAYNSLENIRAGSQHLSYLLDSFGNLELALAAYNAGEWAVIRYGYNIPPYPETRQYVERVLAFRDYFDSQTALWH